MLQLSLFTACLHPLKRNIEKNKLHKWNVLQQKNFKLGYFIFLHKSPKRLILDPLKRNKKQLHLSSNISASKTAFKHRISSSIYSMTECLEGWCMTDLCHSVTFSYVPFSHISFSWITELHPVESD